MYRIGVQNGSLSPDEAAPAVPGAGVALLRHGAEVRGLQLQTNSAELTHTLGLRHETEIKVNIILEELCLTYLKSNFCNLVDRFVALPFTIVTPFLLSMSLE